MKKSIALFSNDWHLKKDNIEKIKDLVNQKCELAKKLGLFRVYVLGDVFDSRKSQTLDVLKGFEEILDIFKSHDIQCVMFPGNHDKTNYSSEHSFLDPYKHHPKFKLISDSNLIIEEENDFKVNFHILPFFEESIWKESFKAIDTFKGEKNVLLTHIAISGSRNNDGTLVESPLSIKDFKDFDLVFSGHYHDTQVIGKKFVHCPSLYQANFGEDDNKGFTVLYDDLTYEIIQSKFKKYIKIKIDLDTVDNKELARLTKDNSDSEDNIRFEFIGSETKLKSLKKELFTANGIEVATKVKEIEDSLEFIEGDEVISFTNDNIMEEFTAFCEKEELKEEDGKSYLTKKLNING